MVSEAAGIQLSVHRYGEGHMRTRMTRDLVRAAEGPDHYMLFRGLAEGGAGGFAAAKAAKLLGQVVQEAGAQLCHAEATPANCARVQRWLEHALQDVSGELLRTTQGGTLSDALTSTCMVLLRFGDRFIFACVGPSNAFVFRGGQAYRLGPSRTGPPARSTTSYLGGEVALAVHTQIVEIVDGDVFFVCSPGLVPDGSAESLLTAARREPNDERAAASLVAAARRRGETGCASVLTIRTPGARSLPARPSSTEPVAQRRQAKTLVPKMSPPAPTERAPSPAETNPAQGKSTNAGPRRQPPRTTRPDGGRLALSHAPVSPAEIEQLGRLRLFEGFTHEELEVLAEVLERRIFHPGVVIVREGERSNSLFVLTAGSAGVGRNGQLYARLLAGQAFGEMALLSGRPRTATIDAQTLVRAVELRRDRYERLAIDEPALTLKLVEKLALTLCLHLEKQLDVRMPAGGETPLQATS